MLSSDREVKEKKEILQNDFSIEMTKTLESEVSIMCNLSKGVEEKGIQKGILLSIRNLMETMGWLAEQAMEGLKIPEEEKRKYLDELKKPKKMQSGRGDGVSVIIKTQAYVDKNGKECNPLETPNTRFIHLKRPKIQYIQNTDK